MKLFKISPQNIENLQAQLFEGGGQCSCSDDRCVFQCSGNTNLWILLQRPCGCIDCDIPGVPCDMTNDTEVIPMPCMVFDMVSRTCFKGMDENGCAIIGQCLTDGCLHPCSPETPCLDDNPCCNMFLRCDELPSSETCGQCVTEQTGQPSDCFNCPECDSSMCDGTDPPPPPPPPPPPAPPPSPPSPPSPPPPGNPPCKKYAEGMLEYRDGVWVCVDKITREEIPADCCDLPGVTPTITVTDTTGPTATPTTIGPTPTPETKNPCENLTILESIVDNIVAFEQLCNCKCDARYTCFNGACVQDPNGDHNSYLSCLNYLCDGGVCGNSLPEPTPLPQYPVCQDPLIIDQ